MHWYRLNYWNESSLSENTCYCPRSCDSVTKANELGPTYRAILE